MIQKASDEGKTLVNQAKSEASKMREEALGESQGEGRKDPGELAEEAAMLEEAGADEITIMDSAGTMLPEETAVYVEEMKKAVTVPIGFHGHNNLGLAVSNSCTAYEHGASVLDTGLMGMARSAGNCPTEVLGAVLMRRGINSSLDLYTLLEFIDRELSPAMEKIWFL